MVIQLDSELEAALKVIANRQGVAPEVLAVKALRDRFVMPMMQAHSEWEKVLLETGSDCGVSLPNEALSSDGLYD